MNFIKNTLLLMILIQFLIFLYVKLIYNIAPKIKKTSNPTIEKQIDLKKLVSQSILEVIDSERKLPQSSEYTLWDQEMIDNLNKEIKDFNDEIKKIVYANVPIEVENINIAKKIIIVKVSSTKKVEKYAKEKLGQEYVWGATGPLTFDCSGFTRDVFHSTIGIKIPRVSRDQAKIGTLIEYKKLKRGDMVFFDTEKKYSGKVNHVGIYLNNGNFIHASSAKKKVIITNFKKKPFYKKRFLWGRRVINKQS